MASGNTSVNIMWFRRDLRLSDNAAFYHALRAGLPVVPLFIFDRNILDQLEDRSDDRLTFLYDVLNDMKAELRKHNSDLELYYGKPAQAFAHLLERFRVNTVFTNRDFEQYAIDRDAGIDALLQKHGAKLSTSKDQVIFEAKEVSKDDGSPYSVFTPFKKRWLATVKPFHVKPYPTEKYMKALHTYKAENHPSLADMNFQRSHQYFPPSEFPLKTIDQYDKTRDYPALEGTSRMSVHLRFGTVSIRALAATAMKHNDTYLNELIWRDFYQMILETSPAVRNYKAFKPAYDGIAWRNNEAEFEQWCQGQTGYPMVDAGMRQLNETGFMHNRVRMVTASFLCKHLLIDWRWGEAYFAKKLLDYDYASNNGGWQWAAGSGCDAAPYFRVFNPQTQQEKFDKDEKYIRQWVPEYKTSRYTKPMVVHEMARKRALDTYKEALSTRED